MPHDPRISFPLDIPEVRVLAVEVTKDGEYLLSVESTRTTTPCRRCGRILTEQHGLEDARQLRHLPIFGHPVYLQIRPKRFRCRHCSGQPTTTQQLDWYDPNALHTKAYERSLIVLLVNSTISDVVVKEDVSYDALLGILGRWIATSVDWEQVALFDVLGLDEIALTKGHRNFVAVITARTKQGLHVLAILPDRLKTTVAAWLRQIPEALRSTITTVCTDMWEGYIAAVQEAPPQATIVIDRFHVAHHYQDAVDDLRKMELRRLQQELPDEQQADLKRIMWVLRKGPATLTDAEQERLARLFAHRLALQQAHRLREELTRIFATARSRADGLRRIRFWQRRWSGAD